MKNKTKWIVPLIFLILLLIGAAWMYPQLKSRYQADNLQITKPSEGGSNQEEKFRVPDFEIQDWDGNTVEFSSWLGKPTIINFWASWCPYCLKEMPLFETIFQQYGDEINFLMIDSVDGIRETVKKGKDYLAGYDYTFPVYFDTQLSAVRAFQIQAYPATFLIDAEGNFVAWVNGMVEEETLRQGVSMLLDE